MTIQQRLEALEDGVRRIRSTACGRRSSRRLRTRSSCWLDPETPLLIAVPKDFSFPSGHTLSSAIGATVLTGTDRRFGWAAIPLAVLMAFSRLYLYVHFPSDVLAGAVLGVGIGLLAFSGGKKLGFLK